MESSQLIIENRTSPYFGKYMYRAQCRVMGACYTYYTNNIDQFVEKLERTKANKNSYRISILNSRFEETYDHIDLEQIKKFYEWKNSKDNDRFMYRVQGNMVSFFSNDIELLKTLDVLDSNTKYSMAKVEQTDVLYFKTDPKYKYRTFFKGRKMPTDFQDNVENLQKMYGDKLHFSPGMVRMINKYSRSPYRYMHTSYYIDYDDEGMRTILALWFGDLLAKTFSCKKQS